MQSVPVVEVKQIGNFPDAAVEAVIIVPTRQIANGSRRF
jgi:hypothetical protein